MGNTLLLLSFESPPFNEILLLSLPEHSLLYHYQSAGWQRRKYWGRFNLDRQDFSTFGDKQTGAYLLKFSWFPVVRHTLVKGRASPDDPRLKDYWAKRQAAKAGDLTLSKQKLSKRQKGRCPQCFESLFNDEELQIHHRVTWSDTNLHSQG